MLGRPSCRAEGRSGQPLRELDGLQADATSHSMHDDGATRVQPGTLESSVRRAPRDGQRAHLLKGNGRRLASNKGGPLPSLPLPPKILPDVLRSRVRVRVIPARCRACASCIILIILIILPKR